MTDYSKLAVSLVYSENSDYSDPGLVSDIDAYEGTPTMVQKLRVAASVTGVTVRFDAFTTITSLIVKNTSSTISVTAAWTNAALGSASQVMAAGKIVVGSDVRVASNMTLTSASGAPICDVYIIGT